MMSAQVSSAVGPGSPLAFGDGDAAHAAVGDQDVIRYLACLADDFQLRQALKQCPGDARAFADQHQCIAIREAPRQFGFVAA